MLVIDTSIGATRDCESTVSDGGEVDNGGESNLAGGDAGPLGEGGEGGGLASDEPSDFLA
jgi:hypothetical protein